MSPTITVDPSLTLLQWRALPGRHRHPENTETGGVLARWRAIVANRQPPTAVAGQLRLTGWAKNRWQSGQALVRGLTVMGLAFAPLALCPRGTSAAVLAFLVVAVVLPATGSAIVYPFEMDTVIRGGALLSRDRIRCPQCPASRCRTR
ncbi:hypothetical protein ACFU5B_24625 [Streptomyces murinus]|uniref:hypothetical protein n=1 Tax=Streptomyces murinus TaxID=33900 RepID=UPI0036267287